MSANNSILIALAQVIADYLGASDLAWAAAVTTSGDYRAADEEATEVLGQYLPVPCVIVRAENGPADIPTVPVLLAEVTVLVRDSIESVTLAVHESHAGAVAEVLWDTDALEAAIAASPVLTLSGLNYAAQTFVRNKRAFETTFALTVCISSKSTV